MKGKGFLTESELNGIHFLNGELELNGVHILGDERELNGVQNFGISLYKWKIIILSETS